MSTTIDIDTGGTFTDAFVVHEGRPHTVKVLTTPHDLAVCFVNVLERAADDIGIGVRELLRDTVSVRYATTVGTNAIIQRTGPRLGLIAGPGGERLYSSNGEADRVFDLFLREDMVAVVGAGGDGVSSNGDAGGLVEATRVLLEQCARGLVCSMPGADVSTTGERTVREGFEQHYPKHCLDAVPLLLSHEVASDPDDFRRTATALFNAYVHPDVASYLYRAEDHLRENDYRRPLLIVHNDGGCARVARTIAARTYNSGPTAGLMGAEVIADLYDIDALVTFDMGGTSLDVAFLTGGEVPIREHGDVEGVEISFALPELLVLGAGGGSIAHIENGELKVGPQSAGAKPGPACFGFGGTEATVTDADLVLGILDPDRFLGGQITLDRERAERAIGELASQLGRDMIDVAADIRRVVDEEMGHRIAADLRERGVDPADAVMLAYGGAGPMHAASTAAAAGIREIVTVPFASVFSAFGASSADVRHTHTVATGGDVIGAEVELRRRALRDMRGEGFAADDVELVVEEVELHGAPRLQVRAQARLAHHGFAKGRADAKAPPALIMRDVHWPDGGAVATAIHAVEDVGPGASVAGPAVIEAGDTTYAVPRGWTYDVDEYGNAWMRTRPPAN